MNRTVVRKSLIPLVFGALLAMVALGPLAKSAAASGECYWGGLQDKVDNDTAGGAAWTTRVKFNYGYNCSGQIISIKVTYARWTVSFYNGGDYDPDATHTVTVAELYPWPYDDANGPRWVSFTDYSCTGGCYMGHTYISGSTPVTWGSSAYSGSGKGFYDSMFSAKCIRCTVDGQLITYVEFNFPRNNLVASLDLQGCSTHEGRFC